MQMIKLWTTVPCVAILYLEVLYSGNDSTMPYLVSRNFWVISQALVYLRKPVVASFCFNSAENIPPFHDCLVDGILDFASPISNVGRGHFFLTRQTHTCYVWQLTLHWSCAYSSGAHENHARVSGPSIPCAGDALLPAVWNDEAWFR